MRSPPTKPTLTTSGPKKPGSHNVFAGQAASWRQQAFVQEHLAMQLNTFARKHHNRMCSCSTAKLSKRALSSSSSQITLLLTFNRLDCCTRQWPFPDLSLHRSPPLSLFHGTSNLVLGSGWGMPPGGILGKLSGRLPMLSMVRELLCIRRNLQQLLCNHTIGAQLEATHTELSSCMIQTTGWTLPYLRGVALHHETLSFLSASPGLNSRGLVSVSNRIFASSCSY